MKDKSINKSVIVVMVLVVIVSFLTLSYAFFSTIITNGTIYTTSGTGKDNSPNVELIESNSGLSLTNAFPMSDQQWRATTPYTFSVKNNGTASNLTSKVSSSATTSGYTTRYLIVSAASLASGASTSYNLRTFIMESATTANAANKTWVGKVTMEATIAS